MTPTAARLPIIAVNCMTVTNRLPARRAHHTTGSTYGSLAFATEGSRTRNMPARQGNHMMPGVRLNAITGKVRMDLFGFKRKLLRIPLIVQNRLGQIGSEAFHGWSSPTAVQEAISSICVRFLPFLAKHRANDPSPTEGAEIENKPHGVIGYDPTVDREGDPQGCPHHILDR